MAEIFRLPAVSPTMELGTLVEWRIDVNASFSAGDVIAEIGTDKATIEAEVYDDGVLLARLVEEDDEVPVNAPIAIFGEAGEDIAALVDDARAELASMRAGGTDTPDAAEAPPAAAQDAAAPDATAPPPPAAPAKPAAPPAAPGDITRTWMGKPLSRDFMDVPGDLKAIAVQGSTPGGRVIASPLARKVAQERGVDLHSLSGSGPGGRIVRADVESAPVGGASTPASPATPADETLKLSPMRKTIAKRLLASHQDIPTFFLTIDLDMTAMVDLRKALKASLPDTKISYNDMLIAAAARALRAFPQANASFGDKAIVRHGRVDVGMAVAVDDGLLTPVIRNADTLGLAKIAEQTRSLAARAREGRLTPEDYTGGTFTISNLGMFGIEHFTAIINPPEAAILAVGALAQVPVVVDGALTVGWRMKATLTCDHRVLDGAVGSQFLQVLRRYVEQPALMLV